MPTPIFPSRPVAAGLPRAAALVAAGLLAGCQVFDDRADAPRRPSGVSPEYSGRAPAVASQEMDTAAAAAGRATILLQQGMYEQALAEFERAIESNPNLTVAYIGAGDIYRQQGDYDKAAERYGEACQVEPRNFTAQYSHGLMLQLLDRVSESVRAYLRALSIRPDDFNSNLNLGIAFLQLKEPGEALPYAERAVQIDGKNAPARINLGAVYAAIARHEDAVTEYQQAAELVELSAPLLLNLADSLGKAGRNEEMVNTLEQLARTEPTAVGYERLGSGLFRLRRYDESIASFRKGLDIDPNHFPALNGVAVCLLNQWVWSNQQDEPARREALDSLRRSLQIERNQPKIMELLGRYQ